MESRGKVLVTGIEGLIGRPLHGALLERGYEVVPYDMKGDRNIFDRSTLEECLEGCDTVIHLAAISWPNPGNGWEDFWLQNCQGVYEVAEAAHQARVQRFIFTSSMAYYGVEINMPVVPPFRENGPHMTQCMVPDDIEDVSEAAISYIQSKVVAENILAVYGYLKKMQVVVLRVSPVRGTPYLGSNVYNENLTPALVHLVDTPRVMWYEVFNFSNPSNAEVAPMAKWDEFWGDDWEWPYS